MFVHLKQSGELLASQAEANELWTPTGVVQSAEKILSVFEERERLELEGLVLVTGAGNIVRGDELRDKNIADGMADVLGRIATVQNTIVLADALEQRDVPVQVFIASNMQICDTSLPPDYFEPYDVEAVHVAHQKERVVLIAGGTGEDGKTTDNAVLEYARRLRDHQPGAEILVLKGTKYDGVYTANPAEDARARRIPTLTAGFMLENYVDYSAVDRACLETIQESGIDLRVYADGKHDLQTVIEGDEVGTLITPGDGSPALAPLR